MTPTELVDKYLGRQFGQGKSGCFLFVKEVYKKEFGIEIDRDYIEMLSRFRPVEADNLRFGDIVLMRNHPIVINHIGIYLGGGEFIHYGGTAGMVVSRVTDDDYQGRIAGYLRHSRMKND